jgi:hypothetical protein
MNGHMDTTFQVRCYAFLLSITLYKSFVRFDALTAVMMPTMVFWVITPCGLVG